MVVLVALQVVVLYVLVHRGATPEEPRPDQAGPDPTTAEEQHPAPDQANVEGKDGGEGAEGNGSSEASGSEHGAPSEDGDSGGRSASEGRRHGWCCVS